MPEFKIGDVVRLKSGGPDMTVADTRGPDGARKVCAIWFDDDDKTLGSDFPVATLVRIVSTEDVPPMSSLPVDHLWTPAECSVMDDVQRRLHELAVRLNGGATAFASTALRSCANDISSLTEIPSDAARSGLKHLPMWLAQEVSVCSAVAHRLDALAERMRESSTWQSGAMIRECVDALRSVYLKHLILTEIKT